VSTSFPLFRCLISCRLYRVLSSSLSSSSRYQCFKDLGVLLYSKTCLCHHIACIYSESLKNVVFHSVHRVFFPTVLRLLVMCSSILVGSRMGYRGTVTWDCIAMIVVSQLLYIVTCMLCHCCML